MTTRAEPILPRRVVSFFLILILATAGLCTGWWLYGVTHQEPIQHTTYWDCMYTKHSSFCLPRPR